MGLGCLSGWGGLVIFGYCDGIGVDLARVSDWLKGDKGRFVYVCGWTQ